MGLPNIGPLELIIILAIALLIVGPGRLPEMGNAIGRTIREFRKASTDITDATKVEPDAAATATTAQTSTQPSPGTAAAPAPAQPEPNTLSGASEPNTTSATSQPSSPAASEPTTDGNDDA